MVGPLVGNGSGLLEERKTGEKKLTTPTRGSMVRWQHKSTILFLVNSKTALKTTLHISRGHLSGFKNLWGLCTLYTILDLRGLSVRFQIVVGVCVLLWC
jgi:hypothetical protein